MDSEGLYTDMYAEFLANRARATGYDFGQGPPGNVPPPTVTFATPLSWWSLDRPRRLAAILAERDRLQNEILALARGKPVSQRQSFCERHVELPASGTSTPFPAKEHARHGCPTELRQAA